MYGYECRTGSEVVAQHRSARLAKKNRILELRSKITELLQEKTVRERNEFIRRVMSTEFRCLPFTPNARNFRQAASDRYDYSCAPVPQCGDEYYSACGMEDHYGEMRDYARVSSIEYFRAWKYLKERANEMGQTQGGRV